MFSPPMEVKGVVAESLSSILMRYGPRCECGTFEPPTLTLNGKRLTLNMVGIHRVHINIFTVNHLFIFTFVCLVVSVRQTKKE